MESERASGSSRPSRRALTRCSARSQPNMRSLTMPFERRSCRSGRFERNVVSIERTPLLLLAARTARGEWTHIGRICKVIISYSYDSEMRH